MSELVETETFVVVAQEGSFAAAGERLGISSSYVSKLVTRLEDRLGVRLLHRTTRKLTLTESGAIYHEVCAEGLELVARAQDDLAALQATPRGRLRVTFPTNLGLIWLAGWLADFGLENPQLHLEVVYLDRAVDLVGEGFDVAIRAGILPDSSLIGRRLTSACRVVVASPAYLAGAGTPMSPEELADHDCLLYSNNASPSKWRLGAGEDMRVVKVSGRMTANNGAGLVAAAIRGLGLAYLPDFHVGQALAAGELVRVLPAWGSSTPIHVLYPSGRHLPTKTRAFIDSLAAYLETPPWA